MPGQRFLEETFYKEQNSINLVEVENDLKTFKTLLQQGRVENKQLESSLTILHLWKYQLNNNINSIEVVFLEVLALLIKNTRLCGFRSIGTELVRSCIRDYLPILYRNLNNGKKSLIQATLNLLHAMVSHSPSTASDLMAVFNFNLKPLPSFLNMRLKVAKKVESNEDEGVQSKTPQQQPPPLVNSDDIVSRDIRGIYIKFLLAFLIRGDSLVKKNILETKNLLNLIFKDIKNDCFETVEFILSTLHQKVLNDARIPRTTKIHFFHHGILQQLLGLYSNTNPAQHSSSISSTVKSDESETIADLVHNFFVNLCTIPGQGLCFQDQGWYMQNSASASSTTTGPKSESEGGSIFNPVLGKFLLSLKISNDMKQRELFLSVIQACPELVHYFWTRAVHLSFEPRSSVYYIANIALVTSVIQKDLPLHFQGKQTLSILSPPAVAVCLSNILPAQLTKQISSKALQHSSRDVRFACCRQLAASFEKLEKVLEMAQANLSEIKLHDRIEVWQVEKLELEWQKWQSGLLEGFRAQLPDPNIIILLHKSARAPPSPQDDPEIDQKDLITAHLVLLKYYLKHHNAALLELKYDFGKLLNGGGGTSDGTNLGWNNEILLLTVQILRQVDGFKWWNKGDAKITFFRLLLDLYLVIADPVLKKEIEGLFNQFLDSTASFQGHARTLKTFWKLVWKQCSEVSDAVEKELVAFTAKGSKLSITIVDGVPPLYANLIKGWDKNLASYLKLLICSLVVNDCLDSGVSTTCLRYLTILNEDGCAVKARLINWLQYSSGQKIQSINVSTLEWKKAKSLLKETELDKFTESLFQISPQSFNGNWDKLFKRCESFASTIYMYIQLVLGPQACGVDSSIFETPAVSDTLILLELKFQKKGSVDTEQLKSFIEKSAEKINLYHILFFIDSWRKRDSKRSGPLSYAFNLVHEMLQDCDATKMEYVHNHPSIVDNFLPVDLIYEKDVYDAVLNIVSLGTLGKSMFKMKFIEYLTKSDSQKSPLVVKSFHTLLNSFGPLELDSIARLVLKNSELDSSVNEILWMCISRNQNGSSRVFLDAMMMQVKLDKFPVEIHSILDRKTGIDSIEIIALVDEPVFISILQKKALVEPWKFACWICSRSLVHAIWIAEQIKSDSFGSLSKEEKYLLFKSLVSLLFYGKWRDGIPKQLWKVIKSLCKSTMEVHTARVASALTGAVESSIDRKDVESIHATVQIHGTGVLDQFASVISSKLRQDISNVPLCVGSILSVLGALIALKHEALSISLLNYSIWLISFYYQSKKKSPAESEQEKFLEVRISKLIDLITSVGDFKLNNADVNRDFVVASLKYRLHDVSALKCLKFAVQYCAIPITPAEILEMITSHSLYDSIIESVVEENKVIPTNHASKASLLDAVLALLKQDPSKCCKIETARKLALHYYGTTSESDVASLKIFTFYERVANISMSDFLSSWGNQVDTKIACFAESLGVIDNVWMANSIHWFPVQQEIDAPLDNDSLSVTLLYSSRCQPVYDPSFFLPLAAAALADKNVPVDVHRLLETNLIGLAVMALSSQSLHTRQIGHFIIYQYYDALSESSVKEKNQVLLLLDSLRNSMNSTQEEPFPVISGIISSFVAQGLMILMKPESDMYPLVNRFCLQRDQIDLLDMPMFYELFYSTSDDCRKERIWILRLIGNGLKSKLDYQLLARRHVFSILFSFFNSPIADSVTRKLILEILLKASQIPSAVSNLVTKCGLLVFLKSLCATVSFTSSNDLAVGIPLLLNALFIGYSDSPDTWDGKLSRGEWISQFFELVQVLLAVLKNLSFSKQLWACTFTARLFTLCHSVVQAAKSCKVDLMMSLDHLQIFQRSLVNFMDGVPSNRANVDKNVDAFFVEDEMAVSQRSLVESLFFDILFVCSSTTIVSSELLLWAFDQQHVVRQKTSLLEWALQLMMKTSVHKRMNQGERKQLMNSLFMVLSSNSKSADRDSQLARACIVLLLRDADIVTAGTKRAFEDVAVNIHFTPTPKFLLNTLPTATDIMEEEDNFQALAFSQMLSLSALQLVESEHATSTSLIPVLGSHLK